MNDKKQLLKRFIIFELLILLIGVAVYKFQMTGMSGRSMVSSLKLLHKTNGEFILDAANPIVSEVVNLDFDNIKEISVDMTAIEMNDTAVLEYTVANAVTGEIYAELTDEADDLLNPDKETSLFATFDEKINTDDPFVVKLELVNARNASISVVTNMKFGIVESFNGDINNKTNIVSEVEFGKAKFLKGYYLLILILIMVFVAISFYLFNIKEMEISRKFLILATALVLIYQIIIPVGGAPDEPWHLDTAYKYSNIIMGIGNPDIPGTIYKRKCDAIQSDVLANQVDSNSYYQFCKNIFTIPKEKELLVVSYNDTTNQVSGLVYLPAAIGISLGRLFGLSAIMAYTLGRIFAAMAYIAMVYFAICLTPFGKNVMTAVGLLPISIQQAGSLSYDVVICGAAVLMTALIFNAYKDGFNKFKSIAMAALALVLITSKGGVYAPVILLFALFLSFFSPEKKEKSKIDKRIIVAAVVLALAIIGIFVYKYVGLVTVLENADRLDGTTMNEHYTFTYFIGNMRELVALYWNTIFNSNSMLLGSLGGRLGWNEISMPWILVIIICLILVMMANVAGDKITLNSRSKIFIGIILFIMVGLVWGGMLLGYTEVGSDYIKGIQGRYFLPFEWLIFLVLPVSSIHVEGPSARKLWTSYMMIEAIVIFQVVAQAVRF